MPQCHSECQNAILPKCKVAKCQNAKMSKCKFAKMLKRQNDKIRQKYREIRWNVSKVTKICQGRLLKATKWPKLYQNASKHPKTLLFILFF